MGWVVQWRVCGGKVLSTRTFSIAEMGGSIRAQKMARAFAAQKLAEIDRGSNKAPEAEEFPVVHDLAWQAALPGMYGNGRSQFPISFEKNDGRNESAVIHRPVHPYQLSWRVARLAVPKLQVPVRPPAADLQAPPLMELLDLVEPPPPAPELPEAEEGGAPLTGYATWRNPVGFIVNLPPAD